MKKNQLFLILLSGIFLFSCNLEEETPIPTFNNQDHILLSSSAELNNRVKKDGTGIIGIVSKNNPSGRYLKSGDSKIPGTLPLEMVAQINLPKFDNKTFVLTGVDIKDNFAFVTYAGKGSEYLGAIEILDLSNRTAPKISSQAVFTNAFLNDVKFSDGILYISAAFDISSDQKLKSAANLITVSTANGNFSSDFRVEPMRGESTSSVAIGDNHIISSSKEAIALFNKNSSVLAKEVLYPNIQQVAYTSSKIAVLKQDGEINLLDPNTLNVLQTIKKAGELTTGIEAKNGKLYVAEGTSGTGVYDLSTGNRLSKISIPQQEAGNKAHSTHWATTNDNLILMANGAAGISISEVNANNTFKELGTLELKGNIDFVKASNGFIITSSGSTGLQVIRINTIPQVTDNICSNLKVYDDCSWIIVKSNRPQANAGITAADGLEVSDKFTFCGALSIKNWVQVHPKGQFNMRGSLTVGSFGRNTGMIINETFIIDGELVIYGNLSINKNAKIEFIGNDSKITVHGKVTKQDGYSIKGKYIDTEGKL